MKLKKLQISGFKSFVDPTDVHLPGELIAVVGPNGCGKSNIIDAVRWVMGESSAKLLRGESLSDVIFNGSAARKPVGKASVELLFDNADGSAGGEFAKFTEISIQRTLSRDGQSRYFINRIKSRRKDVLDLFLGTGLGPRSYAIIEQGMVGRIVEAHPEELRGFVEEAAGTTKYRERRRETELRIARTQENLSRISDIRAELEKHLRRLKRQANAATRYKTLRQEQRLVEGQLLMLELNQLEEKLTQQAREMASFENALQATLAKQRATESEIETLRQAQIQSRDAHDQVQEEFYSLGAQIKSVETRIADLGETQQRNQTQRSTLQHAITQHTQQLKSAQKELQRAQAAQQKSAPQVTQLEAARQAAETGLEKAETELENWQIQWDDFNARNQQSLRASEVQQSRITQLKQHLKRSDAQISRIHKETAQTQQILGEVNLDELGHKVAKLDLVHSRDATALKKTELSIQSLEQEMREKQAQHSKLQSQQHEIQSRLTSLEEIQTAALGASAGEDAAALQNWLHQTKLSAVPKLASLIRVADGWQHAADRLLGSRLGAYCVDALPPRLTPPGYAVTLLRRNSKLPSPPKSKHPRLLDFVEAQGVDLGGLLGGVYVAEALPDALALQDSLTAHECVVTRDATLVGSNWVSFPSQTQAQTGILLRKQEMSQLQTNLNAMESRVAKGVKQIQALEKKLHALRERGKQQRSGLEKLSTERSTLRATFTWEEARQAEMKQRVGALEAELGSLDRHISTDHQEIAAAEKLLAAATAQHAKLQREQAQLEKQKSQHQRAVSDYRAQLRHAETQTHQQALHSQQMEAEIAAQRANIARLEERLQENQTQLQRLAENSNAERESAKTLQQQLQQMLTRHLKVEKRFRASSDALAAHDAKLERALGQQSEHAEQVNAAREALAQQRMAHQEISLRRDNQVAQIEKNHDPAELAKNMPSPDEMEKWQRQSQALEAKISRIGAVNLVAIDEYAEENQRKQYLDQQYQDLHQALETLRNAIQKIDHETRTRFKKTFTQLNAEFNRFFPKLFGGGKAELSLVGDDLLTTGIIVTAQPPGKRNSHIHLLSGGEKALTAIALLFSLFKLNPAPFCMLDEVDAPLDDANVLRYCETLRSLAKSSQLIIITHNKITVETAEVLVGVTMGEPGVSRLVSVDLAQAVKMVEKPTP